LGELDTPAAAAVTTPSFRLPEERRQITRPGRAHGAEVAVRLEMPVPALEARIETMLQRAGSRSRAEMVTAS
jgi:hypothetical protein